MLFSAIKDRSFRLYHKGEMRKGAVIALLSFLFFAIAALFWHNEWVYSLPTPVPRDYKTVEKGNRIAMPVIHANNTLPVFLHFFNPDCPCSRFNMPHFRSLVKQYSNQVNFAIVVMSDEGYTEEDIQERFRLRIPVLFDTTLADRCGVYSTPQAVILTENRELFYRGNYNKSRYCTDKKSNYAQIALDSLLANHRDPRFNHFALQAYGCELPACTKKEKPAQ
jgi:hypothetical protein